MVKYIEIKESPIKFYISMYRLINCHKNLLPW